jgi:hypothetical protein
MPDPQNPQAPSIPPSVTVTGQAPAPTDTTAAPLQTQLTPPATPAQPNATLAPGPAARPSRWSNFKMGWGSSNPQFGTDANGQITQTNPMPKTKGGILGAILGGALAGAAASVSAQAPRGATGYGAAASAGAQAAFEKRQMEVEQKKTLAQQNFVNAEAAKKAQMQNGIWAMQQAQTAQQMEQSKAEFLEHMKELGVKDQADALSLQAMRDQRAAHDAALTDYLMSHAPAPTDTITHETGSADNIHGQAAKHAPALIGNQALMLHNGQQGNASGVNIWSKPDLDKPISEPFTMHLYDGTQNKDGSWHTVDRLFQPDGQTTYRQVAEAGLANDARSLQLSQQWAAREDVLETKARTAEAEAGAKKDLAQAFQASMGMDENGAGGVNINWSLSGPAFEAQLPGPAKSLVDSVLHYQAKPTDLGRGTQRTMLMSFIQQSDPNKGTPQAWTEQKYDERQKFLTDYGSAKGAAGAQRTRLNTAVGHLDQLYTASQDLAQNNVNALNAIANAVGAQIGKTPMITYQSIANKAAGEMAGAIKGGSGSATDQEIEKASEQIKSSFSPAQQLAAVRTSMQLLNTTSESLGSLFQSTMGVSPDAFGQPVLSPQNSQLLTKYGIRAPQVNMTSAIPAGAFAVRDSNNNVIGYQTQAQRGTNAYTKIGQ